jgi:large subunit ribosomal protein L29
MKYSELQNKTQSELAEQAYTLKKGIYSLNMQKKLNQLTNTTQIRKNRRDLARVLMQLSAHKKK